MHARPARIIVPVAILAAALGGCETAPREQEQDAFLQRADATVGWFEVSVDGLTDQINDSAAYIVFPDVAQWGIIFSGGRFGRGALCRPDGEQIGWAALNTLSLGPQAGAQGFRMLILIEDEPTLDRFRANQLSGSASGVAVAAAAGVSATTRFQNGVAVYDGANRGLMAGVNIGLDNLRYRPLEPDDAHVDLR